MALCRRLSLRFSTPPAAVRKLVASCVRDLLRSTTVEGPLGTCASCSTTTSSRRRRRPRYDGYEANRTREASSCGHTPRLPP